jgi:uncharacterized protein (TIGR02147 family)
MAIKGPIRPNVRQFNSYREYLRSFYLYKKLSKPGFSFRKFSDIAGIKSPNFLHLVMSGRRNMSEDMGLQVSKAMGLMGAERSYFMAMIKQANARRPEEVADANRGLLRAVNRLVGKDLTTASSKILSHWHHCVVKELALLPDFEPSGEWISKKLRGLVGARQAEESLELLLEAAVLCKDDETGQFEVREPMLDTGDSLDFARVLKHHLQTLDVWKSLLPTLGQDERELGMLVFPVSKRKLPQLKERIRQFQKDMVEWLQEEQEPDSVMQLGTYLLPLTE